MVDDPAPAAADPAQQEQLDRLLALVSTGTSRLLGETISVTDEDWRAPSRLPGWSRGHVATHIARQADGLVRLTEWARGGTRTDMYGSPGPRGGESEGGGPRPGARPPGRPGNPPPQPPGG